MANTQAIQEAILRAVDTVVTQRTNELQLDKTITAIVRKNLGFKNEKPLYQLKYSGGIIEAVCQSKDDTYLPNTAVYVLIPQGNFSNEKIILGYANNVTINSEKTAAVVAENLYTKFSGNLLSNTDDNYGLHSWHEDNNDLDPNITHRYLYIYQKDKDDNDFSFNQEKLNIYQNEATALMIKADFQTNLDIEQRQQLNAKYGLIFNFTVNNNKNEQIILSSDQMTGNAFLFNQWNSQYKITELNEKTLVSLDNIIFFQENFLQDYTNEQILPSSDPGKPDIWTKNIQIYLLKDSIQTNDFSLKVEPYNDSDFIFTKENKDSTLWFKATFLRKFYEDLTSNLETKIQWFKESSSVIDSNSENYNYLAGAGWEEIVQNENNSPYFSTTINENKAFKNNYKCLVQYSTTILSYEFSIYNNITAPRIILESDYGTNFSFKENLSPTIIVKIKDEEDETFKEKGYNETYIPYPQYQYTWCIVDNNKNKIFLSNNDTNDNIITQLAKTTILKDLKEQTLLVNGNIIEQKNSLYTTRIILPTENIENNFSVICYVQKNKENDETEYYNIGSAQLDFTNVLSDSDINNYVVEIKNDDQVFKYDVYGKAPTDESYKDPLIIKPLQVTLKTLTGMIIDSNNYQVEWIFPTEDTLLILNTAENNICNFDIQKDYNPDYYNNQITCHISYNEINLYKETKFYFGKEGDNGTNGTDIIAKIEYARNDDYNKILQKQPVTLYTYNNRSFINTDPIYNMRETQTLFGGAAPVFKVSLYQRSNKLNYSVLPRYSLAGNKPSRYFKTGQNLTWISNNDNLPLIQNLKAEVQLNNSEIYYAFITLPIIEYHVNPATQESLISIDKQYYLNEIVYNSDGRNPIYNHNKGLKLNLPENISVVEYRAKGGFTKQLVNVEENTFYYPEFSPCFSLLDNRDSQAKQIAITKTGDNKDIIYILPNDNYGGSVTNNRIEARCYDSNNILIATVYAPIYMSLNTFGLASLNAWDGNSVTIDNEGGYVMAPQVGAGEKDNNNRFTGILMGKTETYTGKAEKEKQVGLFGYAKGLQSIFLDAETGNATFGLPDGYTIKSTANGNIPVQEEDDYGEGRIELRPGGESKIGGWKIGRRSLYYTMKPFPILNGVNDSVIDYIEEDGQYKYEYSGEIGLKYHDDEETPKNRDYAAHHRKDIKTHDSGILFSSDPPYMSIVGTMLTTNDIVGDSNAYLDRGDSIEIQLDPQTPTVFTIFRHNSEFRKQKALEQNRILGDRTFLAGINSRGQLQANIIGTTDDNSNQASMYFGLTRRFNQANDDDSEYIGAIFEGGNNSITQPYMELLIDKTEFNAENDETIENVYLSVPGKLNVDFAPTTYTSNDVAAINIDSNGHYVMTVGTLEEAIEGCLKAAESSRTGNLYIYNGTD